MFERDYILRMFTILGRALARILFFRETKSYDSALLEVDNTALSILGLNSEVLEKLPVENLKDLFGADQGLLNSRLHMAGVLLKEKGEILFQKGDDENGADVLLKSLRLMTEDLNATREMDDGKGAAALDAVIDNLREYNLDVDLKKRLVNYHVLAGRYDKSEDLIFEIVEEEPAYLPEAVNFYEELDRKSDIELENGRLPRDEVREALASLRNRLSRAAG